MKFTVQYIVQYSISFGIAKDGDDFLVPGFQALFAGRPAAYSRRHPSGAREQHDAWLARTERLFLSKELPPLLKTNVGTFPTYEEP
jgi:hypothetical protein